MHGRASLQHFSMNEAFSTLTATVIQFMLFAIFALVVGNLVAPRVAKTKTGREVVKANHAWTHFCICHALSSPALEPAVGVWPNHSFQRTASGGR